jgi:hypothetical protein
MIRILPLFCSSFGIHKYENRHSEDSG